MWYENDHLCREKERQKMDGGKGRIMVASLIEGELRYIHLKQKKEP